MTQNRRKQLHRKLTGILRENVFFCGHCNFETRCVEMEVLVNGGDYLVKMYTGLEASMFIRQVKETGKLPTRYYGKRIDYEYVHE